MSQTSHYPTRLISNARKAPKLSHEEEKSLLQHWQRTRDRASAQRLAQSNMRHVVFTALKFKRYGVPVEELICEGNIGLMRAMDKFNPEHGTRFATYACYWIRSYVVACALKSRTMVGGGSGVFSSRTFFRLKRERAKARSLFGDTPEATLAVCQAMRVSEEQLVEMEARVEARDASLDAPMREDQGVSWVDVLVSEAPQMEEYVKTDQLDALSAELSVALNQLNAREKYIVERRLMADDDDELSLSQLGSHFGVSRERVRQLEERAKEKLRMHMERAHRKTRRSHELNVAFA